MLLQQSDLEFFHLLCTSHKTPYKQVENCNKPGNLVDQIDSNFYVWSHKNGELAYLRLIISKYFFEQPILSTLPALCEV